MHIEREMYRSNSQQSRGNELGNSLPTEILSGEKTAVRTVALEWTEIGIGTALHAYYLTIKEILKLSDNGIHRVPPELVGC